MSHQNGELVDDCQNLFTHAAEVRFCKCRHKHEEEAPNIGTLAFIENTGVRGNEESYGLEREEVVPFFLRQVLLKCCRNHTDTETSICKHGVGEMQCTSFALGVLTPKCQVYT